MSDVVEHVRGVLEGAGIEVDEVRELPTALGWQVRGAGGVIVSAFKTGKCVAQGKRMAEVKALLDAAPVAVPAKAAVKVRAAVKPVQAAEKPVEGATGAVDGFVPRFPTGWSWEPWDGVTPPW